ncbi:MAG: CBS domain-containing protein [Candidatus Mcinerneyibacterium aminivorans]|uniref:CBS domain-containing protein n=1 Tax=Candidatus Mcinerneyibacterium aminivorans TaxID=2703815 RepID=A0A5D0MH45_9BACT|nr:MAG: CBS domain-containing protein [Candidatus Mcinerneyibacterium aminivorans]
MKTIESIIKKKGDEVFSIGDDKKLLEAVKLLNEKKIGALLILNDKKQIEGIISERDILREVDHDEGIIKNVDIKNVMTKKENIIVAHLKDDIDYAMSVMLKNKIRHLPVLDEEGNLEGIISIGDVLKSELNEYDRENKYLKDYISGKYPV